MKGSDIARASAEPSPSEASDPLAAPRRHPPLDEQGAGQGGGEDRNLRQTRSAIRRDPEELLDQLHGCSSLSWTILVISSRSSREAGGRLSSTAGAAHGAPRTR